MKAKSTRTRGGPDVVSVQRLKLNLSLDPSTHARLTAYAAFRNEPVSVVVARACEAEMRASRFVVYLGATGPALADGAAGRSAC